MEVDLRRELFQWDHFAGDMIVDPFLVCGLAGGPNSVYADYGLQAQEIHADGTHDVLFRPLIESLADVEKIRRPEVWVDRDETEQIGRAHV